MEDDPIKILIRKCAKNKRIQVELFRLCAMHTGGAKKKEISDYLNKNKGLPIKRINKLIDAGVKIWQR